MAKGMRFNIKGRTLCATPEKIERKKLYGYGKTLVFDDEGNECETASLDEGAAGIIPKGGAGLGILSPEGLWVERSTLKAVDANGRDAPLCASSYDSIVTLIQTVPAAVLLDYCITALYELSGGEEIASCIENDIYMFDYCYRASYEPQRAFIITSGGGAFMMIGYRAHFDMLALREETLIDDDDVEEEENDEEIDFSFA